MYILRPPDTHTGINRNEYWHNEDLSLGNNTWFLEKHLPVNNVFKVETVGQPAYYRVTQTITVQSVTHISEKVLKKGLDPTSFGSQIIAVKLLSSYELETADMVLFKYHKWHGNFSLICPPSFASSLFPNCTGLGWVLPTFTCMDNFPFLAISSWIPAFPRHHRGQRRFFQDACKCQSDKPPLPPQSALLICGSPLSLFLFQNKIFKVRGEVSRFIVK